MVLYYSLRQTLKFWGTEIYAVPKQTLLYT